MRCEEVESPGRGRDLRSAVESRGTGRKRGITLQSPQSPTCPARQEQAKSLPPFQEAKPKGCGTLVTYRPDDVRDWPFLLLSDLKEFKLPPARPYCCAEERLTFISPPKRKSLSAPRNSKASWSISCSADILINRNWQKGGISSFDTSRNTETRLRSWLIVVSPRGKISSNASGCPGFSSGSPYANTSDEMISLEVRWAFLWNPTSSIGSPQRLKALSCSRRANSTVRPLFSSASKLRVPSCCAAALKNDRIAEWHLG